MVMVTHSDPRQYVRLASYLREQIASGKLAPGESVPSITVLCRQYETSRRTAGKAMQVLEKESLLLRVPGLGYFVRDPADAPAQDDTDAPAPDDTEGVIPDEPDGQARDDADAFIQDGVAGPGQADADDQAEATAPADTVDQGNADDQGDADAEVESSIKGEADVAGEELP